METATEENKTTLTFSDSELDVNQDAIFFGLIAELQKSKRQVQRVHMSSRAWINTVASPAFVASSMFEPELTMEVMMTGNVGHLNFGRGYRCPITTGNYDDPRKREPRLHGLVVEITYEPKMEFIPLLDDRAP